MNPTLTNGIRSDFANVSATPAFAAAFGGEANARGAFLTAEVDALTPLDQNVGDYLGTLNDVITRYLLRASYDKPLVRALLLPRVYTLSVHTQHAARAD